jgi:dienelactone hydrolase
MSSSLSRRELGFAALGSVAVGQQNVYDGPLQGVESKVDLQAFDPLVWLRQRHASAPLQLTFRAGNRVEAEHWQRELRARVTQLIGGFPGHRCALKPQTLETRDFEDHRREKLVFQSRPGVGVLAYLLTPKTGKPPYPTVICHPGHSRGADDLVGLGGDPARRPEWLTFQHDYALRLPAHGVAAVVIEPLAFGCRRDPVTRAKGPEEWACQPVAAAALLFGETMIAWRVFDVMRTIDWIETRKELDSSHVGGIGISGGGTAMLFSAALEERIRAVMVSGYLNTFRDSILSLEHCIDNYVPGILNWAEMYDVAGLIAPRPLFAEAGTQDEIFPIAAFHDSFARVRRIYEVLEAPAALDKEVFEGPHDFRGTRGIPFLARHLRTLPQNG